MTPDFGVAGIHQTTPYRLAFRRLFTRLKRKVPSSFCRAWKIAPLHPVPRLLGMSASRPLPQPLPDLMVHPAERILGRDMPVIVGPATNDRIQQFHQHLLAHRLVRIDYSPDLLQESVRVLLRWFGQGLA